MSKQSNKNSKTPKDLEIDMRFNDDFDPKYSKRITTKSMYDGSGRIRATRADVCDCLDNSCSGCHFPCRKCQSNKCGKECRRHRNDYVDCIRTDGEDNVVYKNTNFRKSGSIGRK